MAFRTFTIPVNGDTEAETELNNFLQNHRVLSVRQEFVQQGAQSFWAFCVDYQEPRGSSSTRTSAQKKPKVDYREVLSAQEFQRFDQLRKLRKQIAEKEGVPVYAVFSNQQLACMVQQKVTTKTALQQIEGIGTAKVESYGDQFLKLLQENSPDETSRKSNAENSGAGESS